MKTHHDTLEHFLFEDSFHQAMPIRGNLVRLNQTQQQALQHQALPTRLKQVLGELMAASALLSATLKMEGALILQLQSKGAIPLLVVECSSDLKLRATAKWDAEREAEIASSDFLTLVKNGHFVITLDPTEGEAYQGIVPIEGASIAEMLQNYMLRSQQIDTSLWLQSDGENAAGMLLQKLPNVAENDADAWNRVNYLANTVTPEELDNLSAETLLTRLFSEENVRLFEPRATQFKCSCNKTKVGNMLRMLGVEEVNSVLTERDNIEVLCDFCQKQYLFDAVDAAALFVPVGALSGSSTVN
jgi:molecular chaperone Hsp33